MTGQDGMTGQILQRRKRWRQLRANRHKRAFVRVYITPAMAVHIFELASAETLRRCTRARKLQRAPILLKLVAVTREFASANAWITEQANARFFVVWS